MLAWMRCLVTNWRHNRGFAIWTSSILALLIRVANSFALKTYQFDAAHEHWAFGHEWGRIAKWLALTGMFSLDGSKPASDTDPLYIFMIAPFFQAFGVFSTSAAVALILFQSLLCGLSTWAIFVLAEKLYGPFEARLSALFFAVYPASIFFAVNRIGPSSLSILLLCLTFLVVVSVPRSRRLIPAVVSGFLMAAAMLSSSDNLSLFLVVPLWLILIGTGQRWRMVLMSFLAVGTAILVLLPWSLRNAAVIGEPTITKANLGYHLWVGNNPYATGHYYTSVPPAPVVDTEQKTQSRYYEMAISWIVHNPKEFLILTLKRIQYFWYVIPERGYSRQVLLQAWLLLTALALAVVGLFWPGQRFEKVSLLLLFVAIYPLVFYVTHASFYRHRYHIEPFIIILASHGIHGLWALLPLTGRRDHTPDPVHIPL